MEDRERAGIAHPNQFYYDYCEDTYMLFVNTQEHLDITLSDPLNFVRLNWHTDCSIALTMGAHELLSDASPLALLDTDTLAAIAQML